MNGVAINGNVFDGRNSRQRINIDPSRNTIIEVRYYWMRRPQDNAITTAPPNGAIFLGPNWFADTAAGRARTLIHEAVHLIGNTRDSLFDPGKGGDPDAGSNELRKIIADKCNLPPKGNK
jgi:hypothetical protein